MKIQNKVAAVFTGMFLLAAASCSTPVAEGPQVTLRTIAEFAEQGDYEAITPYLYGVEHNDKNSADRILDGIRERRSRGDFAFSKESFRSIANDYEFAFYPAPELVINALFIDGVLSGDDYLTKIAEESPERITIFSFYGADLVFVESEEGVYQLVFTRNATRIKTPEEV